MVLVSWSLGWKQPNSSSLLVGMWWHFFFIEWQFRAISEDTFWPFSLTTFYEWGNWTPERLSNLPTVPWLMKELGLILEFLDSIKGFFAPLRWVAHSGSGGLEFCGSPNTGWGRCLSSSPVGRSRSPCCQLHPCWRAAQKAFHVERGKHQEIEERAI